MHGFLVKNVIITDPDYKRNISNHHKRLLAGCYIVWMLDNKADVFYEFLLYSKRSSEKR